MSAYDAIYDVVLRGKRNQVEDLVQQALDAKKDVLEQASLNDKLASEKIDVTLPGRGEGSGSLHPVTRTRRRIEDFFVATRSAATYPSEPPQAHACSRHPARDILELSRFRTAVMLETCFHRQPHRGMPCRQHRSAAIVSCRA